MTTQFWREWLEIKAQELNWSDNTVNGIRNRLFAIYAHSKPDLISDNPLEGVKPRKLAPKEVAVYELDQIRAILNAAWEHDRELVPFFAIAIFAGLRPESEIMRLEWKDVNFEEKWIRVNYDNKTQTKRFVPIFDNLMAWLIPWRDAFGPVTSHLTNFTKRRRNLTRGKYQSPLRTSPSMWTELAPYGHHVHDITRHTFGSYMDAATGHDRNKIKEWMGHSNFDTFEQHYRNARTNIEGADLLRIIPPT